MNDPSAPHRLSRRRHAATAQFHRWFQLYERPRDAERVERQLRLFADRFEITTADGRRITSRDAYREGITAYGAEERHAHHVRHLAVTEIDPDHLRLDAEVHYERLDASGRTTRATIAYEGELIGSADFEPLFTTLKMTVADRSAEGTFTDAYPANRALSVIHRFLSLVEAPDLGGSAYDEFLGPDGELDLVLGTATVTSRGELARWLAESSQRLAAGTSRHTVEGFQVVTAQDGLYTVGMDLDWNGATATGEPVAARLRYDWTLRDTGERYCRLVRSRNEPLVPVPRIPAA
ncbi:hypothetical protein [Streptomyces sp. NBC_01264]|uniref:hypothetical protein n=1 Tax=Streptomyces sp. NBC_01264 TaxID=2903804 RepID=UPI00225C05DE|nr:hypothetical protein [Streptomyces sp. NBC_01264]MCX4781702.1 hypothetical protein [Streptomyces sp. NBC_01264]